MEGEDIRIARFRGAEKPRGKVWDDISVVRSIVFVLLLLLMVDGIVCIFLLHTATLSLLLGRLRCLLLSETPIRQRSSASSASSFVAMRLKGKILPTSRHRPNIIALVMHILKLNLHWMKDADRLPTLSGWSTNTPVTFFRPVFPTATTRIGYQKHISERVGERKRTHFD